MNRLIDSVAPRGIMRLLVISYFAALSLGLIGGTAVVDFLTPVLPASIAIPLMKGLILTLCALILVGIGRRTAALILSLVVFYASYTALYTGGDIGAFWRDLALIGALLLTADFARPGDKEIDWPPLDLDKAGPPKGAGKTTLPDGAPGDDQRFREDLDMVRAT